MNSVDTIHQLSPTLKQYRYHLLTVLQVHHLLSFVVVFTITLPLFADKDSYIKFGEKMNETFDQMSDIVHTNDRLLATEAKLGDIVMLDVIDTYRNLTEKLVHFMRW